MMQKDRLLYLICKKLLSQSKVINVKCQCEKLEKTFLIIIHLNLNKQISQAQSSLQNQQQFMTAFSEEADVVIKVSFFIAWNISPL